MPQQRRFATPNFSRLGDSGGTIDFIKDKEKMNLRQKILSSNCTDSKTVQDNLNKKKFNY